MPELKNHARRNQEGEPSPTASRSNAGRPGPQPGTSIEWGASALGTIAFRQSFLSRVGQAIAERDNLVYRFRPSGSAQPGDQRQHKQSAQDSANNTTAESKHRHFSLSPLTSILPPRVAAALLRMHSETVSRRAFHNPGPGDRSISCPRWPG